MNKKYFSTLIILFSIIFYSCQPNSCGNGIQDNGEIGIDCGGTNCPPCNSTCTNGVQDGNETGIDCGGNECSPCSLTPCSGSGGILNPTSSFTLNNQAQVDSFGAFEYNEINSDLWISNATDLSSLCSIKKVNGLLAIQNSSILNLSGLENLESVGGIRIAGCDQLTNIDELISLTEVEYNIIIHQNDNLLNVDGLNSVASTLNYGINIEGNIALETFDLPNAILKEEIYFRLCPNITNLNIESHDSIDAMILLDLNLLNYSFLQNVTYIGRLDLVGSNIVNLDDLSNLIDINSLDINSNQMLNDFCGLNTLINNGNLPLGLNLFNIGFNLYNPTHQELLDGDCTP